MIARRVRVTGRVQGVFFRAWTRDEARRLGVSGWARNCDDGSVEAHVEGDEAAVGQLIEKLRNGPPDARVDDLQASEAAAEGSNSFDVRH
jgi:acylphosphatase